MLRLLALLAIVHAQAPAPSFAQTVLHDFDAWDRDHDGALSATEIDHAALSPWYHGEDAAALAALGTWLSVVKDAPRLTKDWFATYRPARLTIPQDTSSEETARLRKAYAASPDSLASAFAMSLRRLAKVQTRLYLADLPALTDIRQGQLGDCFMLAPLGAMLHRDPNEVARMIQSDGQGGYQVKFGDGKAVSVNRPTDAEIAMGGSSTANGLWVRIVEKAYGSRDFSAADADTRLARNGINGGHTIVSAQGFTGHRFMRVRLGGGFRKEIADTDLVPMLDRIRGELTQALAERRLVLAGTPKGEMPASINAKHAYAVFDYDAKADRITLWNPHGNDFVPRGEEGFENGFRRTGGVFSMPLPQFARAFEQILFEGSAMVRSSG